MVQHSKNNRYLFVISTTAGWKTTGQRLSEQISIRRDTQHRLVAYNSNRIAKRITQHKDYHDIPWHIPLLDSFTVNSWLASNLRGEAKRFDAVIAGHITQAAAMLDRNGPPVIAYVDTTRHLNRSAFNDMRLSDAALDREHSVLQRVAHVIALSEWAASDIVEYYGLPRTKITVIPPAAHSYPVMRERKGGAAGTRLRAIFIGSDFVRKGGDRLVEWQRSELHRFIDLAIVTDRRFEDHSVPNTKWLGPVDNALLTSTILPEMELLCLPTRKDCSAIVVAEAAMAGIPAVVNAVGGIPELVEEGITGYIVDPYSESSFISRVRELAADPHKRERLSRKARQKAMCEFAPSTVYQRIIACADNVVRQRNSLG